MKLYIRTQEEVVIMRLLLLGIDCKWSQIPQEIIVQIEVENQEKIDIRNGEGETETINIEKLSEMLSSKGTKIEVLTELQVPKNAKFKQGQDAKSITSYTNVEAVNRAWNEQFK